MAIAQVNMCRAMDGDAPVIAAVPRASEALTTSGTSAATTITAEIGDVVNVRAVGGGIWVTAGAAPTAAEGTHWFIPDGGFVEFGMMQAGWKIAAIDA